METDTQQNRTRKHKPKRKVAELDEGTANVWLRNPILLETHNQL
jgi:hypothetical protein